MKFLVCIALLVAVAAAEPGVVGYGSYGHGLGLGGLGYAGGYASPYGGHYAHAPVIKAIAPVATSYANVHSVHQAAPAAYGYGAYPYSQGYAGHVGHVGHAYGAYPSVYGAGAYGHGAYGHGAIGAYKGYGLHY